MHVYTEIANFVATLTITDAAGHTSQSQTLIQITASGLQGTYVNNWTLDGNNRLDVTNPALVRIEPQGYIG